MTSISVTPTTLRIQFSRGEKLAGLVRDLDVSRQQIVSAGVVEDGLSAVQGVRAPGLALPGSRKVGTWRRPGARTLVAVRRGQPALEVRLTGARYDELLIGDDDARQYADQLAAPGNEARQ